MESTDIGREAKAYEACGVKGTIQGPLTTYKILGQVWYLIVSIPGLCTPTYFYFPMYTQYIIALRSRNRMKFVIELTKTFCSAQQ